MYARALTAFAIVTIGLGCVAPASAMEPLPWFTGDWRSPGGSCMPAYLQLGATAKSRRNEAAVIGTVSKDGIVVMGKLVQVGARRGQLVSDSNDSAIFLLQERAGGLRVIPISVNVLPWGEAVVEKCP